MIEITPTDPEVIRLASVHRDVPGLVHTDLAVDRCECIRYTNEMVMARQARESVRVLPARPVHSGNSCRDCGGMMVRTGTCETCTECGSTGGCG